VFLGLTQLALGKQLIWILKKEFCLAGAKIKSSCLLTSPLQRGQTGTGINIFFVTSH
jgi:hypothetical protein